MRGEVVRVLTATALMSMLARALHQKYKHADEIEALEKERDAAVEVRRSIVADFSREVEGLGATTGAAVSSLFQSVVHRHVDEAEGNASPANPETVSGAPTPPTTPSSPSAPPAASSSSSSSSSSSFY